MEPSAIFALPMNVEPVTRNTTQLSFGLMLAFNQQVARTLKPPVMAGIPAKTSPGASTLPRDTSMRMESATRFFARRETTGE